MPQNGSQSLPTDWRILSKKWAYLCNYYITKNCLERRAMKQLTLTALLLPLSIGIATGANASVRLTDVNTLFDNEAHGFEGETRLACQTKGSEVAETISEIVGAASTDSPWSLLISSIKFVNIGTPFIDECGEYMKDDEKEVLTALVNFANGLGGQAADEGSDF